MTEFNTAKRAYFKSQQTIFTPAMGEKQTLDYEQAAVCQATGLSYPQEITQAWRVYFQQEGLSNVYSRHLSDLWYQWLATKGFTQASLRDRLKAFYEAGTVNL
jgi:hypothetical protein